MSAAGQAAKLPLAGLAVVPLRKFAETLTLSNNCGRRDGFRGRTLGERSEQSLTLKLSGGRADVLPPAGEKAAHQRVERRASVHGFSVSRGVREQKPFRYPQDAVGFGIEQLYLAELLNETANCFVSVVAGCAGAVHDVLSSGERFGRCSSTLRSIDALTRTVESRWESLARHSSTWPGSAGAASASPPATPRANRTGRTSPPHQMTVTLEFRT